MSRAHAVLSASSSSRWIACPPSALLQEKYRDYGSVYAEAGSEAHALGESKVLEFLGKPHTDPRPEMKYLDQEMEDATDAYASFIAEQVATAKETCPDPLVLVEQEVDYSKWADGGFGTADAIIVGEGHLWITDLKYGTGIEIDAQSNSQLSCYALGAIDLLDDLYDFHTVTLSIFQPRRSHISSWTTTREALLEWGESVLRPAAQQAIKGEGKFCAGDHCRFCKAKHEVVFTGTVYELYSPDTVSAVQSIMANSTMERSAKAMKAKAVVQSTVDFQVSEGTTVSIYHFNKTDNTWVFISSATTNRDGTWKLGTKQGLIVGDDYSFVFTKEGYAYTFGTVERLTYTAQPGENHVVDVYGYSTEIAEMVEAFKKLKGYSVNGLQPGLFAEYFVFGKKTGWDTAENKRNEGTIDNIDFLWKGETIGGLKSYYRLNSFQYSNNNNKTGTVNYVPIKFAARFNGYVMLKGAPDADSLASYQFRVRGDDGVRITMQLSDVETPYTDEDWSKVMFNVEKKAMVDLTSGSYLNGTVFKINVEYYNDGGTSKLILEYSTDKGKNWQTVPKDWLYQGTRTVSIMDSDAIIGVNYATQLAKSNKTLATYTDNLLSQFLSEQAGKVVSSGINIYNTNHVLFGDHQLTQFESIRLFWTQKMGKKAAKAVYSAVFDDICNLNDEATIWEAIKTNLKR